MTAAGLREAHKARTREDLRAAALELVDRDGLHAVSVEQIAEAAGVSTRTFFNYFATKSDALLPDAAAMAALARDTFAQDPAEPVHDTMLRFLLALLETRSALQTDPVRLRRVAQANPELLAASMALLAGQERLLAELVAERTGLDSDRDVFPRLLAAVGMAVLRSSAAPHGPRPVSSRTAAARATASYALLRGGLVPPPPTRPVGAAR